MNKHVSVNFWWSKMDVISVGVMGDAKWLNLKCNFLVMHIIVLGMLILLYFTTSGTHLMTKILTLQVNIIVLNGISRSFPKTTINPKSFFVWKW